MGVTCPHSHLVWFPDAEAAHREMLRQSEAKLASQRRRLAALQRTLQRRGRAERDSEKSRQLLRQTTEKELFIGRLQDEIRKKRQESDTITQQLREEELEYGGPAGTSSTPPSPAGSVTSRTSSRRPAASAASRRSVATSPPWRGRSTRRLSPVRSALRTARSPSSSYGSPSAGSLTASRSGSARLSPTRATVPPVSPPRRRPSRSPPADPRARAAAARAAARVAAARARLPLAAAAAGTAGRKTPDGAGPVLRRKSSLQSSQERGAERAELVRPAVTRRVRM
ncbi:TBC1 domain family member 31 [Amphibalanus amphitrite]|uniref:TBC1 domain family member 31 n=1 Tax=Amphibalanus amphitrite TaxID=1232801 RepID=A0A6A4W9J3_AMPAM|nr:TBC1 domain family member 31 [Amphibalanus amphitrite]